MDLSMDRPTVLNTDLEPLGSRLADGKGRIMIVDDDRLVAEMLSHLLAGVGWGESALFQNYDSAFESLSQGESYDIIMLDLNMPGMQGMSSIKEMVELNKGAVVLMTGSPRAGLVDGVIAAGGRALLSKCVKSKALSAILVDVANGGFFCSSDFVVRHNIESLTPRESRAIAAISLGQTNDELAATMELPISTVKMIVRAIFKKLDAHNRTEAVKIWLHGKIRSRAVSFYVAYFYSVSLGKCVKTSHLGPTRITPHNGDQGRNCFGNIRFACGFDGC
jgi:two-component system nitrate/nitrite response regulator NarL